MSIKRRLTGRFRCTMQRDNTGKMVTMLRRIHRADERRLSVCKPDLLGDGPGTALDMPGIGCFGPLRHSDGRREQQGNYDARHENLTSKLSDRQPVSVERNVELQIVCHRKIAMLVGNSLTTFVKPILPTVAHGSPTKSSAR